LIATFYYILYIAYDIKYYFLFIKVLLIVLERPKGNSSARSTLNPLSASENNRVSERICQNKIILTNNSRMSRN